MTTKTRSGSDKSVYLVNLGCPKNLVDGEVMLGLLADAGYTLSLDPEQAGVLMVNTCSFIDEAKEESIETILDLAAYKTTETKNKRVLQSSKKAGHVSSFEKQLIVTGCLAQRYGQELREVLPEVDVFVGTGEFLRITEILEQKRRALEKEGTCPPIIQKGWTRFLFWSQPVSGGCPRPCRTTPFRVSRPPIFTRPTSRWPRAVIINAHFVLFRKFAAYRRVGRSLLWWPKPPDWWRKG